MLLALLAAPALAQTGDDAGESLQIGISIDTIAVSSNFTGTRLAIFGTIENGEVDAFAMREYAVVVVVSGPPTAVTVRRKARVLGIWINRESRTYVEVPSFYVAVAGRAFDRIAPETALREAGIGIGNIPLAQLSTGTATFIRPSPEFAESLRRVRTQRGLYLEDKAGVEWLGTSLFRASVPIPANVPTGDFTVTAFLFRNGELLTSKGTGFNVEKAGFEEQVSSLAREQGLIYGILAVVIALFTGWLASVIMGRR